jgi:hypothetical protein
VEEGSDSKMPSREETLIMYAKGLVDSCEQVVLGGVTEERGEPIRGRSSRMRIRGTKVLTEWAEMTSS